MRNKRSRLQLGLRSYVASRLTAPRGSRPRKEAAAALKFARKAYARKKHADIPRAIRAIAKAMSSHPLVR
jgi:hypothetical protein